MPSETSVNFDRAIEYYDETRGFPEGIAPQIGKFLQEASQLTTTDTVLEVGIGTGRIALPFAPYVQDLYGIDISRGILQKLRDKQNQEPIHVVQADAGQIPFATSSFDAIMMTHVLHLVSKPKQVLQEMQRVLKPDGIVLLCRGESRDALQPIADVWGSITANARKTYYKDENATEMLTDMGFYQPGEIGIFTYEAKNSPQHFLDCVEQRLWSSTWGMDDEIHAQGVQAVKDAIREFYPNPLEPIKSTQEFHVRIFKQTTSK